MLFPKNFSGERTKEIKMTENNIPAHVSIIMDGNGRWAKLRSLQRWEGHAAGAESLRAVLSESAKMGVKYLSVYAFSEENWNRSEAEVGAIMKLMMQNLIGEIDNLDSNKVRFLVLGNRSRLDDELNAMIDKCMERTSRNTGITFILLFSYSGRWDITQAARRIAEEAAADPTLPSRMDEDLFSSYLVTSGIPDPDLIIRTSGEMRVSNYLLWQCAYSEFYITDTLWPDFREDQLRAAISEYANRDRRYGKTK